MKFVTALTDFVAAPLFRTDAEGRRVFVPSAVSSDRFLIPDAAAEARLRTRMARLIGISIAVSLLLIAVTVAMFGPARAWTLNVWLGIGAAFVLHFFINLKLGKGLAKGLAKTEPAVPVGFVRAMADQAAAWPRWLCWLELIVGPLVLFGGITGLRDAATTYDLTLSLFAIPLSGLMVAVGLAGLLGRKA